jgi:hypothetical protein
MKVKSMMLLIFTLIYGVNAQEGFEDFIPPVSNPIHFESPFHTSEARLIHIHQELPAKVNEN